MYEISLFDVGTMRAYIVYIQETYFRKTGDHRSTWSQTVTITV